MPRMLSRRLTTATVVAAATFLVLPGTAVAAPDDGAADRHVSYTEWDGARELRKGSTDGARTGAGGLVLSRGTTPVSYTDPFGDGSARTYDAGTWTSPVHRPGFDANEAIASWNADTPTGTWIEVQLRGKRATGAGWTTWYEMARWASGDDFARGDIHRTSVPDQADDDADIWVDTFHADDGKSIDAVQVRVTLYRLSGTHATPRVSKMGVMASALPDVETVPTSDFTLGRQIDLRVPEFSQNLHEGHYPEYDGGGEAWCSPTSTTMALYHWRRTVSSRDTAWVEPKPHDDPQVDYAARYTYDHDYEGAGNWPFNTAYAAGFRGMDAYVTRLRTLAEAERFVARGIPLVISVSFDEEDMDGAGYSTNGHLFVIAGFTKTGDVIINDPATSSDATVTRVYKRGQVENAWVPHSGGLTYIMRPSYVPLPTPPGAEPNW
ncbi:MAG: hypothetical protein GEV10_21955 [Streptosporangiales bacterium]|nr:hypothetical protein [Streptosporangiales bacterium]